MKIPVTIGDYVFTNNNNELFFYEITNISLNADSKLCISVSWNDDVKELQWDNDFFYLEGKSVIFLRASLVDYVSEYRTLENISPYEDIVQEDGLERLIYVLNNDDFWACRFLNDFVYIPNIHVIMGTKPYDMDWRAFYKHFITMSDLGNIVRSPVNNPTTSIFAPLYKLLGL